MGFFSIRRGEKRKKVISESNDPTNPTWCENTSKHGGSSEQNNERVSLQIPRFKHADVFFIQLIQSWQHVVL